VEDTNMTCLTVLSIMLIICFCIIYKPNFMKLLKWVGIVAGGLSVLGFVIWGWMAIFAAGPVVGMLAVIAWILIWK
jgi:hypothetical protein